MLIDRFAADAENSLSGAVGRLSCNVLGISCVESLILAVSLSR
jgi:hypothetical protein